MPGHKPSGVGGRRGWKESFERIVGEDDEMLGGAGRREGGGGRGKSTTGLLPGRSSSITLGLVCHPNKISGYIDSCLLQVLDGLDGVRLK